MSKTIIKCQNYVEISQDGVKISVPVCHGFDDKTRSIVLDAFLAYSDAECDVGKLVSFLTLFIKRLEGFN